jgi:CheY-like chemotaxis protein
MSALRKILVVDDDPVVGTSFNRVLGREGYIVVTAQDGAEALGKLDEGDYDVVYTDIRMPGMDGLELAERVKARRSWTPVVIITGYGSEASERRAKAAGVTAFLHKPLSPEMIEASAKEAVEAAAPAAPAVVEAAPAAEAAPVVEAVEAAPSGWKFAAMLVAGPLLGLAYAVLLPFVGMAMLAKVAIEAAMKAGWHRRIGLFVKNVALFVAAPFIGLAYIVLLPFAGIGTLLWLAVRGNRGKETTE